MTIRGEKALEAKKSEIRRILAIVEVKFWNSLPARVVGRNGALLLLDDGEGVYKDNMLKEYVHFAAGLENTPMFANTIYHYLTLWSPVGGCISVV